MSSNKFQKKNSVLIVDDQPDSIRSLIDIVKREYDIQVTTDGARALDIACGDNPPDLILLDILMPDMDGYEVCRRLKADEQTRDIPVVFVTVRDSAEDEEYGFNLGAVDYISKPFKPVVIRVRVKNQMQRKLAEDKIAASLKEKEVLLREIHHRVRNNMQVIVSLMRMHSRRIDDVHLGQIFDDCRDRVNTISLIHESLYQSENMAQVDFAIYLKKLCRNMNQTYNASRKGILLTVGQCDVALNMDQGIAIGMVISELVSNAFKHAFPLDKAGSVSIYLCTVNQEVVKLIVQDDGKGMPPEIDILNSPSIGLRLVVGAVTRELGGSIELERDGGTRYIICFKFKIQE